jgi:hypothetical protein
MIPLFSFFSLVFLGELSGIIPRRMQTNKSVHLHSSLAHSAATLKQIYFSLDSPSLSSLAVVTVCGIVHLRTLISNSLNRQLMLQMWAHGGRLKVHKAASKRATTWISACAESSQLNDLRSFHQPQVINLAAQVRRR